MSRVRLAIALVVIVPLGFLSKASRHELFHGYAGGALYEVFWIFAVLFVRPAWSPVRVAAGVFAATSALELLQLWHPPWLETVRATFVGRTLIGSTFAWWDFVAYAIGCVAAVAVAYTGTRKTAL